jgi:hypothetical protein
MGCDYYICKVLYIYYNENGYIKHEISREGRYYNYDEDHYDEDEDDYDMKINEYFQSVLIPRIKPIVIYENHLFNKPICKTKYKKVIENILRISDKKWSEIVKIMKVEERCER